MMSIHVITGATGFVGASLALELLRRPDTRLLALVRPGAATPTQRLMNALAEASAAYDLPPDLLREAPRRCAAVAADLTADACGLTGSLDARPTHVWHCAASLNYEDRHVDEIRSTNVDGTRRVLALAEQLGAPIFNHVSTAYVAGNATGTVHESVRDDVQTHNHYERSKIDGERLVLAAKIPLRRIFRPGIVIGHSRTLAATTFSGAYGFIRQLVQFRGAVARAQKGLLERTRLRIRADAALGLNLIPIDAVASPLATLGLRDTAEGVFHLTHPAPPRLDLFLSIIFREVGLPPPLLVDNRDEFEWLDERFDRRLEFYGSYLVGDKSFDRSRTDAALGAEREDVRPLDEAALTAVVRWYLDRLARERSNLPATR